MAANARASEEAAAAAAAAEEARVSAEQEAFAAAEAEKPIRPVFEQISNGSPEPRATVLSPMRSPTTKWVSQDGTFRKGDQVRS